MESNELSTRGDRLRYIREVIFKEPNARKFAIELGIDAGQYHNAERNLKWIKSGLKALSEKGIDIHWLEYGKGSPMKGQEMMVTEQEAIYEIARPRVYVVDQPAFASYVESELDPVFIRKMPTEELPLDLQIKNNKVILKFEVSGDSMEPNIYDKEFVFCTEVEIGSVNDIREKISNSKVYLIAARGRAPMVKRLYYKPKDEALLCVSDNEDKEMYPDFIIPAKDVQSIWYVERKYGGKFPPPKNRNEHRK